MAMSVSYTTISSQIVYENRGGVESYYAPDTLGSTAMLLDGSGTVTDTYTYWPYGEILNHSGSSTTPLTFVGTLGYYFDLVANWFYVRARYYQQVVATWLTVDGVWPYEEPYAYCFASPVTLTDPSGLSPAQTGCAVYLCHARDILSHACVDVTGPQGGCSYSSYPWREVKTCSGMHLSPELWDCDLISTDCNYAGHVCGCVAESQHDYYAPWLCWGNAKNKLCCGCHRLRPGERQACEAKNCAPAFQSPCPWSTPGHTGGGGGWPSRPCI